MPRISERMDKFLQEGELTALEQAALRLLIGALTAADLNNAAINAAIEENAGASRSSLGLGSASLQNADAFDAAGQASALALDALNAANAYTDQELTYRLSAVLEQSFDVTERSILAANLGFKVYADKATANATEGRMAVPFFNQETELYDSTDDIA